MSAPEQHDGKKILELKMTLDSANLIMKALGRLPYDESAQVIDGIRNQVIPQLQPKPPEAKKAKKKVATPDNSQGNDARS